MLWTGSVYFFSLKSEEQDILWADFRAGSETAGLV